MKHLCNILILTTITLASCDSKPKVITAEPVSPIAEVQIESSQATAGNDMHQITVVEVLQAERYTYMKVKEKLNEFWIATSKLDAKIGESYFYQGGLMKTNFESVEHERVFDVIYLVSKIINASAHPGGSMETEHNHPQEIVAAAIPNVKNALKLADLIDHKEKYQGKNITVAGTIVKANYGIMNKNWYHLQDGTKLDGKLCDFTITSDENIPLGAPAVFDGILVLNKNFGAGYVYDLIMENGVIK
jgi:uncharacterized protein YcfL